MILSGMHLSGQLGRCFGLLRVMNVNVMLEMASLHLTLPYLELFNISQLSDVSQRLPLS